MANPIIQREFIGVLRTGRALAAQVALVTLLSAFVIAKWPSAGQVDRNGLAAQQVLGVFGYGMMAAMLLLAPVFPATSIVSERRRGTLALLFNSPMSPLSILIGKLVGVTGFIVLLLLLSLPLAAAGYAMGRIDLMGNLVPMYVVLVLMALQYATLGLLISTYASTPDAALRVTYGLVLVLSVVTMGPHQFLLSSQLLGAESLNVTDWIRSLSPIPAMVSAMDQGGVLAGGLQDRGDALQRFAILAMVSSVVFIVWTGARLNYRLFDRSRATGKITDDRSTGVRAFRRIMYLWFFDPSRRSGLIGPWTNPVMVKEFRTRRFGRSHWMMRLVGGCLIVSILLAFTTLTQVSQSGGRTGEIGGILVLLQMSLLVLITPSLASGVISGERESGGWQMLQMTPLPALRIVTGKLLSVSSTLVLILAATLPGYAVLIYVDQSSAMPVLRVLITLILAAMFMLLVSAAVSSLFGRTATATATAYGLLVGLFAGTLLIWLGRDAPFGPQTVESALQLNPLAAALSIIRAPGFAQYNLVPVNWWFIIAGSAAAFVVLLTQTWRLTRPS